jgi:hypothetical protein
VIRIRVNEEITAEAISLYDDGLVRKVTREEALRMAKDRNLDLVEEYDYERPRTPAASGAHCRLLRVKQPIVWEGSLAPIAEIGTEPNFDPALWFRTKSCKGMHFFLANPHTGFGRLSAWCTEKRDSTYVSKSDIVDCSKEAAYFLKGFLSGQEPDAPIDDEGLPAFDTADYQAWLRARDLFQETGHWGHCFKVRDVCGARLLPSNPQTACRYAHQR